MTEKTENKKGFVAGIKRSCKNSAKFLCDTRSERKTGVWQNKKTYINNTVVVLVVVMLSAVVIFILDAVFGFGLSTVLDLLAKV